MIEGAWQPDAGDLIWTDVDRTNGGEPASRRPALVVSTKSFTVNTGLAVVCPITARIRRFPTGVVLPPGLPISGEIMISHVRSIDIQSRPVRYAGASVGANVAEEVRARLAAIIGI